MPPHLFSKQKIHANRKVCMDSTFSSGGDKRDRTADLLNAIQALSQLSYTPMFNFCCFADRTNCILAEYYPFVNYFFVFLPIEREFFVIWELSAIVDYYKQA
jgi:hypothetical protein